MITKKIFASLSLNVIAFIAMAQPGTLDNTFGTNGMETPELYPSSFGHAVVMQSDGKILTAGGTWAFNQNLFAVARLNSDGSVDSTFGLNGVASILMDSVQNYSASIAIQPDGKIVEAGYEGSGNYELPLVVVRFNADGSIDNGFGQNGKVATLVAHGMIATTDVGVALQSDGKIVLASGVYTDPAYVYDDFALIRYNTDGSLDNSFGNNGIVTTDISGDNYDAARGVSIQPDGKIIAAGLTIQNYYFDFAIVRYNSNGSIDSSFGNNGKVISSVDSSDSDPNTLAIQPDGKIIVGGDVSTLYYYSYNFAVMRFNANGSIDNSFGTNGAVTTHFNSNDCLVTSLLIQPDGKIIAAGNTQDTIGNNYRGFALTRYNSDGFVDGSFGVNGQLTTYFLGDDNPEIDAVLQSDGKIVMVGPATAPSSFAVARYLNDQFTCSANFTLYPDTSLPHHYWAVNMANGIAPISYLWNWGDGFYDSLAYPSHTYATPGFYNICLTIHDSTGCTNNYCAYSQVQKISNANSENNIIFVDVVSSLPTSAENTSLFLLSSSVFPNPTSGNAFINYTLSTPASVSIDLYDVLGNKLQQLVKGDQEQGEHNTTLDAHMLANGVYVLQIRAGEKMAEQKIVVMN